MAFYPRHGGSQLPLTPPDSGSRYGYGDAHFSQKPYGASMQQSARHDSAYDYQQAYMPPTLAPVALQYSSTYTQSLYQSAAAAASMTTLPSISSYYEPIGAPILPPLRTQERLSFGDDFQRISQFEYSRENDGRPAKEEKATGGVSAKLDYDMDRMTNFVVSTTQQMYDLHLSPICVADIDITRSYQQNVLSPPAFRKWVHQVLSATRLPSATILLSLHYLSDRIKIFPDSIPTTGGDQIYRLLSVALILGSKFLDDNTFINRSWSDVTSIKVSELNSLELQWLRLIEYGLHVDKACVQTWVELWNDYDLEQTRQQQHSNPIRLSPLDTSGGRPHGDYNRTRHSPYPTPYSSSTMSNRGFDNPNMRPSHYSSNPAFAASAPYLPTDPWAPSERPQYEDFYKRGSISTRYPTLSDFDNNNRRAAAGEYNQFRQPTAYQSSYSYQSSAPYSATAAAGYHPSWDYSWSSMHRSDCTCAACSYKSWRPHSAIHGYNMGTVMG